MCLISFKNCCKNLGSRISSDLFSSLRLVSYSQLDIPTVGSIRPLSTNWVLESVTVGGAAPHHTEELPSCSVIVFFTVSCVFTL